MLTPETVDIRGISFDSFIEFVFDREVVLADGVDLPDSSSTTIKAIELRSGWWNQMAVLELNFHPAEIVNHYITLFESPAFLLSKYTKEQLEQGFWFLQGLSLDFCLNYIIWDESVALSLRESCVQSMFYLFQFLFAVEPLDTAPYMWWDSLCYDYDAGTRSRANGGEDQSMQDVLFETLKRIMHLPEMHCKVAALHGMGHLHHPDTEMEINRWLEENSGIDDELKKYAQDAANFKVL